MTPSLSDLLQQALSGDASVLDSLLAAPHAHLIEAARRVPRLHVGKHALLRILSDWKRGAVSVSQVQRWASFVKRGYGPQSAAEPVRPVDFVFDQASESLIVDVLGRLDELGDTIDGTISQEELNRMIERLEQ